MKQSPTETKAKIQITGDELIELQRQSYQSSESYGLDARIDKYQGKRPISFSGWDFDSLFPVLEAILEDPKEYPDKTNSGYIALNNLNIRLKTLYIETFGPQRA